MKYSFFYDKSVDGCNISERSDGAWRFWDELWRARIESYRRELAFVQNRIPHDVYDMFYSFRFHDSRLIKMVHKRKNGKRVLSLNFKQSVIPDGLGAYVLAINDVLSFEAKSKSNFCDCRGIDDWVDGELLPVDDKTFSLEMYFASSLKVKIVFPDKALSIHCCDANMLQCPLVQGHILALDESQNR
ncbi:MAG: hypothetical protein LBG97_05750 [Coriobacteriales bacterium]|jgi:hypothetical protein|nr:hypothetical protein [Coriobacteriales bacterium]